MANNVIPKKISTSLYIDGKPAQNSIKNVEQVTRTLRRELNGLTIGTQEWNAKMRELQVHQKTLTNIRNEVRGVGGAFGWLRTEVGKFGTLAAGYLGLQFMSGQFQNIILQNAKLSDSLSSIRRVAEMTEDEVRRLDKSFNDLNTRTSKSGLREMAVIAGRLGVAKDEILGFVEATDMLVVALGDELGNADQITTQLGKILNVFDGEVTGDNITRLGNAMVKLANDGVASAGFISDFAQRVSGMAKTANMGLGAVVGLGAGLEELGARVESSATAVQNLVITIGQDVPKAAAIAKMPVEEFNSLFAKSPEEALLRYAEGLTQNQAAFSDVAAAFKDAGETGVRVIETITKLGERADFLRGKFADGTEALKGYNEIQDAFALMNDNAAGSLDRLQKSFNRLVTNQEVLGFMASLIDHAANAVSWIERNSRAIVNFTKVMTIAVVSWGAYNLAVKVSTATLVTNRTATISAALAKAILTGNIAKATQAMRLLNIAIKMNPIGLLVGVLAAAATAFVLFNNKVDDAAKIQRNLANVTLDAQKATLAERQAIERAQRAIADDTSSRREKFDAVKTLRDIMPDVLKDYSDEEILAGRATHAIQKQTKTILEQAKARAQANRITELEGKRLELLDKRAQGWAGSTAGERVLAGFGRDAEETYLATIDKEIASVTRQLEAMEAQLSGRKGTPQLPFALGRQPENPFSPAVSTRDNEILIPGAITAGTSTTGSTGGSGSGSGSSSVDHVKKDQEDLQKFLKKNTNDIYIDSLEGVKKELAQLDAKYEAERTKAHGNKELLKQLDEQYNREFIGILDRQAEAVEQAAIDRAIAEAEHVEARENALDRIKKATMSEEERELQQMREFYQELVDLADKHGFDVAAVKKKWGEEEKRLIEQQAKARREKEEQEAIEDREKKYGWAVDSAKLVADTAFSIGENRRRAELDSNLAVIEKQREAALANENLTAKQREEINKKFDERAKNEKKKAFKADQEAAIAQAIINGLIGVGKLWVNPGFPAAIPMAAMLGAQTAANVAVIASQKAPEYASGGMTDQDPAGYVGQATLFRRSTSGRPFVAGERGAEWIAPNWMLRNPNYANIIGMLETARQEKRYYAGGGSTDVSPGAGSGYDFSRLEGIMAESVTELRRIKELRTVLEYKTFEDYKANIEYTRRIQGKK